MILLTEGLADEFFRLVIWSDLSEEGSSSFTEEEDLEGSISATDLLAAFDDFDGIDGSDEGLMMFCLVFSDATSFRSKIQRNSTECCQSHSPSYPSKYYRTVVPLSHYV